MDEPRGYVLYLRKSKGRAGVARQRTVTAGYLGSLGAKVLGEYTDTDRTAYRKVGGARPEREGFDDMLAALRATPGLGVAAWHADRLIRNADDTEELIRVCAAGRHLVETPRGGSYDLSTATGRKRLRNDATDAAYEVDHLTERILALKAEQAAAGIWSGGPRPFGYERTGGGLVIRESEAQLLRDASSAVLSGTPLLAIAKRWTAAGVTGSRGGTWTAPMVRRTLLRPRNAGINVWQGAEGVTGQWPAVIDVTLFRGLQAILGDPSRRTTPGPERRWLGGSLFQCGICQGLLHTHHGDRRTVYRCTGHVSRTCSPVDEWIRDLMATRLARDGQQAAPRGRELPDTDAIAAQVISWRKAKDDLVEDKVAGIIDRRQLAAGTARADREIAALNARLAAAAGASPLSGMPASAEEIRGWLAGLDIGRQRAIVGDVFAWVWIMPQRGRPRGPMQDGRYFDRSAILYEWR
jgi:DNA invertase Pin-like site-specific DNA recombinase